MQRTPSRKSPIRPLYALAAAVLAAGVLSVSAPAFAAPVGNVSAAASAAPSSDIILVEGRSGNGNRGGGKGRGANHEFKQGGDRADRDDDWRRNDDGWNRNRRDDRGRVEGRHDRGNHYGWERGRHNGWDRNGRSRGYDGRWSGDRRFDGRRDDNRRYDDRRYDDRRYDDRSRNGTNLRIGEGQRFLDSFLLRDLTR